MLASGAISLYAAWVPDLGWGCALLLIIAFFSEPGKYIANRIIWGTPGAGWADRLGALVLYVVCVGASVGLVHSLMSRTLADKHAIEQGKLAASGAKLQQLDDAKAELARLEAAREEALSKIIPNTRSAAAITEELKVWMQPQAKKLAEAELLIARENARLQANADRHVSRIAVLKKSIETEKTERSRTPDERSLNVRVLSVQNVQNAMNALALASAILLELVIAWGVRYDALKNRPPAAEKPREEPMLLATARSPDAGIKFERWLHAQWKAHRGKDGWLQGSQKAWARDGGFSPGLVHAQLDVLVNAGRIEKKASARNTWVRFLKTGELKIAR